MTIPDYTYRHGQCSVVGEWAHAHVGPGGVVTSVETHADHQGQGHGSDVMRRVCETADATGQPLQLRCEPGLVAWYERFGFRLNGARHYGLVWMVRP